MSEQDTLVAIQPGAEGVDINKSEPVESVSQPEPSDAPSEKAETQDAAQTNPETAPSEDAQVKAEEQVEAKTIDAGETNPGRPTYKARLHEVVDMGGGAVKCVLCEKRSYAAETIMFEKLPYHRDCFFCVICMEKLPNTVRANRFEDEIYCTTCFNRNGLAARQVSSVKWTPKTGSGAATLPIGGGASPCAKCGGGCYPAEGETYGGKLYHKECMRCSNCGYKCSLSDVNRFEDNLFCNVCWEKGGYRHKQIAARGHAPSASISSSTAVVTNPCTKCAKQCYPAEEVVFGGKVYHKDCMRCADCERLTGLADANRFEDNIYCTVCWTKGGYRQKQLAARGHAHTVSSATLSAAISNPTTPCTKCGKQCYAAEGTTYGGKLYHKDCMRCADCERLTGLADANMYEGNFYCGVCWNKGDYRSKQLASRGHAHTVSSATLSAAMSTPTNPCTKCGKQCYAAEGTTYGGKLYHKDCMRCADCERLTGLADVSMFESNFYCGVCWNKGDYRSKQLAARGHASSHSISASTATPTTPCVKCGKQCYPAEGATYGGKLYHKECMRCTSCNYLCGLADVNRFEDNLYCNVCWEKGGYRHKQIAARGHTSNASISEPSGPVINPCTKCGKRCYPAEETVYGGKVYHRECMRCSQCSYLCSLSDVNRFEDNLYCNVCWEKGGFRHKQIAARGHGTGTSTGASTLAVTNPCNKCSKQCYPAESASYNGKVYHKDCMRCGMCSRSAVSDGNMYNGEFYCNLCWVRHDFAKKQLNEHKWGGESHSAEAPVVRPAATSTAATETKEAAAEPPAKVYNLCPKCQKKVYPGDKAVWKDVTYHGACLTCKNCSLRTKPADAKEGPNGDPFCTKCASDLGY